MTEPNAASREARACQAEFLRDLAARIFRHAAPLKHCDQGDSDQLYVIASALADEAASQPREGRVQLLSSRNTRRREARALHDTAPTDQAQGEEVERLRDALHEARTQLAYIDQRWPTGTTPATIAKIDAALAQSLPTDGGTR